MKNGASAQTQGEGGAEGSWSAVENQAGGRLMGTRRECHFSWGGGWGSG